MVKNDTRIASLLGTWTGQIHLRSGEDEIRAFFVLYLMPEPTRDYGCSLDGCDETNNQVCIEKLVGTKTCANMKDVVVNWSDGTLLLHTAADRLVYILYELISQIYIYLYIGYIQYLRFSTLVLERMLK